ncbi:MAG TPA: L-dopachrome tautomerase-related protein [Tepidisphaeraceae bacterium]|nr:L-dopachrome tautomerase-related protein [Tepidisphaeraceae bacterium]
MRFVKILALIFAVSLQIIGCRDDTPRAKSGSQVSADLARAKDGAGQQQRVNSDKLQQVAAFWGPMPTGVAVSRSGRVFVNFPRWGDAVEFTVGEVKDGQVVPYPNLDINKFNDGQDPARQLVSVQSVVVDEQDRLWIVDTGSINFTPIKPGGAKLICVDLKQDKIVKTIDFRSSPDAVLPTTYLNDIRFDLKRGSAGLGYITDSSDSGPNGIIVVDLESGEAWRRLSDHPSTKAQQNFAPIVEGRPLMARVPGQSEAYPKIGSDGIAISGDKKTLYYCPLIGRHLYSVSVDALSDRRTSDADAARTVKDLGDRGYCSDGLETDRKSGRIFLTDYEHNAIHVRNADGGNDRVLVADPRILWPDSMAAGEDGMLYFTANQLHRQKQYNEGKDLRQQPYSLFRIPIEIGGSETAMAK